MRKTIKGKRKVDILPGTGKLAGRTCVKVHLNPDERVTKRAFKGAKPAAVVFSGCFTKPADAEKRAKEKANARSVTRR